MSPLDRIRWAAAVASVHLPGTCYRLAAHLSLVAADGSGAAWCSRQTLAKAIGCDEARLKPAFRALAESGFIVRGALDGPSGRQTYRWSLVIPGAEVAPGAESAPGAEVARPGGAEVAENRGRKSPPKGGSEGGSNGGSVRARFTPPTVEEVAAYCTERGNAVDPERWHDHYMANGWKVGRVPMKDWRAAVRKWEKSRNTTGTDATADHHKSEMPTPGADALAYAAEIERELTYAK